MVFDLEDAVPPDAKESAREQVVAALRAGGFGASEAAVRVNGAETPFVLRDVQAVVAAGAEAVMLPKADSLAIVAFADRLLAAAERDAGRTVGGVRLLAIVESAAGLVALERWPGRRPARLESVCFGHADFSLDLGLRTPEAENEAVHQARCRVPTLARAAGAVAIDHVWLQVRDAEGFRADTARGAALGYEGRLCIHPAQVEGANAVYTPSPEEVSRARRVVEGWERAKSEGRGVFVLDGRMVDAPLVALERRVLARAERAAARGGA